MQSLPVLTVVVRQSVTGMNPPSVHGVMLTVCSIRAMFTANVRELNVITVASSKSQHLLNGRTAPLLFEGYAMMIMADVFRAGNLETTFEAVYELYSQYLKKP